MSSTTASLPEIRRRNPALRIFYYAVCVLLVALIAAIWWLYSIAHSALPQLDGSVTVPGISSSVRVVRDEHGMPTIEAATLEDLFFAQGYVTAQDRLWQMDMMRRAAAGELSEVIGEGTVKMDREQRILGLRLAAEAAEKNISARDRAYFDAYARGVNAFLDSHRDRLSLEFRLMKYTPRPWTVTDSLLVGARMVQDLNHYRYPPALTREKILAKLGPELTADLYVNSSWRDRPPTEVRRLDEEPAVNSGDEDEDDDEEVEPAGGNSRITSASPSRHVPQGLLKSVSENWVVPPGLESFVALSPALKRWAKLGRPFGAGSFSGAEYSSGGGLLACAAYSSGAEFFSGTEYSFSAEYSDDLFRPGSNNWVVSGQHTVSGKPLLSNDMHLDHQMPNLWFEAHLRTTTKAGNFDVAGVTLPGIPFVIVGHNQRIGWGFTNVGPTVEDDFIEEFNAQGQYKTPAGWRDAQHRQETIHVKGKPDVTLDVVTTRHGPIITELVPGETRKIALRWTLQDGMGLMFFDVNSAENWDQFRKAFSTFGAPGQNVMYGDVDGHIGYQATGRVPIRAAGDGSLPVSGSDDAHEWKGWIPFDEMPHVYDPAKGILATANGRITPDGYKYSISTEWDAPWRTDRIYRVLESGKKFVPADMLALQMDVSSTYDRLCADKFVYAVDHATSASDRAKRAVEILRDWDGRMSADSAAPTIETKARQELARLLLEPKLGAAADGSASSPNSGAASSALSWKSYRWAMSSVWLENVLTKQPARWLPPGYSDYGSLLTAAVENAVKQTGVASGAASRVASEVPSDLSQWKWGKYYPVAIDQLVLSQLPVIGRFTGPGLHPLSGSTYTVKAVGRGFGPSERLTWNFANFDESTLNVVTGESGIFLSPYYMDQWAAWYRGSTFAFPFSQAAVEQHRAHEITMVPR
ncbi:MAG TPA: penicillin acylase family protein [Terriglobales bacterium]|nr:penicillin acylase family protein [Terriglobales bacterium]